MTIATALCISILCVGVCAAAQSGSIAPFACNLKAIAAAERRRYNELTKQLRATVRDRTELPDGYALRLDGKAIGFKAVAEWISMERLCCPFLMFQLSTSGHQSDWLLKLTGPQGVKALLQEEFPTR